MRDIILERIRFISEETYMKCRMECYNSYKDLKKQLITLNKITDEELIKFFENFLRMYYRQM